MYKKAHAEIRKDPEHKPKAKKTKPEGQSQAVQGSARRQSQAEEGVVLEEVAGRCLNTIKSSAHVNLFERDCDDFLMLNKKKSENKDHTLFQSN